jgi:hypothetical protein
MTLTSQHSFLPQTQDIIRRKDSISTTTKIEGVPENDKLPNQKVNKDSQINIIPFNFNEDYISSKYVEESKINKYGTLEEDENIRNLLEEYNIKNYNSIQDLEILATMEMKKEDIDKLEKFFKEKTGKEGKKINLESVNNLKDNVLY